LFQISAKCSCEMPENDPENSKEMFMRWYHESGGKEKTKIYQEKYKLEK